MPNRELRLNFKIHGRELDDINLRMIASWFRVQAAFAVERMKEDLHRRIPDFNIILTSNANIPNPDVQE